MRSCKIKKKNKLCTSTKYWHSVHKHSYFEKEGQSYETIPPKQNQDLVWKIPNCVVPRPASGFMTQSDGLKVALCPPAVTCSRHSFPFRLRLALFHNYGCGRCSTVLASPTTRLSTVTKALPSQPHSVVFLELSTGSLTLSHGVQLQLSFTVIWILNTSCFQNQHLVKQCLQHCPVLLLGLWCTLASLDHSCVTFCVLIRGTLPVVPVQSRKLLHMVLISLLQLLL